MKRRVTELEGHSLNLAVHMALLASGQEVLTVGHPETIPYSTSWMRGGPIIERERIGIALLRDAPIWTAEVGADAFNEWRVEELPSGAGPTPLIAAMRAYVCSRLGEEVEIP